MSSRNLDKDSIREPQDLKNLMNIRRGARVVLSGGPDRGKTYCCKEILVQQQPPFDDVLVWVGHKISREYDDIIHTKIFKGDQIPTPEKIDPKRKLCIIIEDCDLSSLSKRDVSALDLLLRFSCTHRGATVIVCCQDFYAFPASLRRKADHIVLWRMDNSTLSIIHRNLSMKMEAFRALVATHMIKMHDSLWFDFSGHPVPVRHNFTTPVEIPRLGC